MENTNFPEQEEWQCYYQNILLFTAPTKSQILQLTMNHAKQIKGRPKYDIRTKDQTTNRRIEV